MPSDGSVSAADDPSAQMLSSDEDWTPRTWKHFQHHVLLELRDGARSVEELLKQPPVVLSLPMQTGEVAAVLDYARRRGLVEPLGHPRRPDGTNAGDEWSLTKKGSGTIRPATIWLMGNLAGLRALLVPVVGGFTALGVTRALAAGLTKKGPDFLQVLVAVEVLFFVVWAVIFVRRKVTGVTARRTVARDWSRWGKKWPTWQKKARQPFPRFLAILTVVAFVVLTAVVDLLLVILPLDFIAEFLIGWLLVLGSLAPFVVKLYRWRMNWSELDAAAAKRKEVAAVQRLADDGVRVAGGASGTS